MGPKLVIEWFILVICALLILNLLLIILLFTVDHAQKQHLSTFDKILSTGCILFGISHCLLLYITLQVDEDADVLYFGRMVALAYCGVFLTEFLSRVCLQLTIIVHLFKKFKKTRFSLSASFIFIFFLLITVFSILLSIVIFDYMVSESFTSLDSDMEFINPLLSFIDYVLNLYFVCAFIRKLYQVTYHAFYPSSQPGVNHVQNGNGRGIIPISVQLSVLNDINESDEESVSTDSFGISHSQYLTVNDSLTLSTVIPFEENEQRDDHFVHIIQRVKILDIMCRTVLLTSMAALFIETVIIYRFVLNFMDLHTHSRIHGTSDEVMTALMSFSMLVNGVVITLNMNVSRKGYRMLCLEPHSCIEMCCIRMAKKQIQRDMIKEYEINQQDHDYRELIDYYG